MRRPSDACFRLCIGAALVWGLLGCGIDPSHPEGGSSSFLGKWHASSPTADMDVTLDVTEDYGRVLSGTVSTSRAECFNNGTLSATVARTSLMIGSTGAGTAASFAVLQFAGEHNGDRLEGLLSMSADSSPKGLCEVPPTRVVFTR
jgi:hypothetical protein